MSTRSTITGPPAPRLRGDQGSVLAELSLVAPFLILLALGIFEFGFVFRNTNVIANGLRTSARVGSQSKNGSSADLSTLQTFMATTGKLQNATVVKVIIYQSTSANGAPPAGCLTASTSGLPPHGVSGVCNVYLGTDLTTANLTTSHFNCPTLGTASWDSKWCPSGRQATVTTSLDYLGVYAEVKYAGTTGLLPGRSVILKDKAVSRIEPIV
jgi:Flp pilus assembly protein TadG